MTESIFWISVLLIAYPLLIYPALLFVIPGREGNLVGAGDQCGLFCIQRRKVIARKIEIFTASITRTLSFTWGWMAVPTTP
jgi:hypothetical protein